MPRGHLVLAQWPSGEVSSANCAHNRKFFPSEGVGPSVSDMKPALYLLIEYTIFCRWLQALFRVLPLWVCLKRQQTFAKTGSFRNGCQLYGQGMVL
jgi:hypothetical protein